MGWYYAPFGKSELMDFPLKYGINAIEWHENIFDLEFPLPRLQMAAIPEFQYGGIENFGLILYRESCFLVKPGITSFKALLFAANCVTHEIVHQWAGDSTSMV